ncbi:MKI67 FHA domain-interacting nucleolar phosphoprotein-like [Daphnia carinata]|uniref:MKI67 FHA domain-interacting nucleolar phosphoprotein-like n=1 Tax=Daphnia carinata TaxID=120202 RepID=UPI00257ABD54|nr:MKI67 FHA domain-interacting nucleolar phosphoprotein-like [Daphnia carinata]
MTDVLKVTKKSEKKKTVAKPVKSDETLLKDAKKRIMGLQKKSKGKPVQKGEGSVKKTKKYTKNAQKRGVVYLGHLPHGFYEEELRGFFSQFGKVARVKVSRSSKTGKSKGYAFVEFAFNDVAKIVAETMNNYLMFERLVKAQYIPPEKVHSKMFPSRFMTSEVYPTVVRRNRLMAKQEKTPTEKDKQKHRGRILFKITRAVSALKEMGIDHQPQIYDPEAGASMNDDVSLTNSDEVPQLVAIQTAIPDSKSSKKNLKAKHKKNNNAADVKLATDSTPTKGGAGFQSIGAQSSAPTDSSPKLTRNQRKAALKKNKANVEVTSPVDDAPSHSPSKRLKQSPKPPAKSAATPSKKSSEASVKPSPQSVKVSGASPKPDSKKAKANTFGKEVAAPSKLPIRSVKGKKPV